MTGDLSNAIGRNRRRLVPPGFFLVGAVGAVGSVGAVGAVGGVGGVGKAGTPIIKKQTHITMHLISD